MAELMEQEKKAAGEKPDVPAQGASTPAFAEEAPAPKKKKKNRKKTIRRIIALVLAAALVAGFFVWRKLHPKDSGAAEVLTEMVSRGSITSVVRGSGAAVAKNSASITLLSNGKVREVFVSEGDYVLEGTPLYEIDSTDVEEEVRESQEKVRDAERYLAKQESELSKFLAKPTESDVTAEYAGILMLSDSQESLQIGDEVAEKQAMATLVDNTRLLLKLYFSYAYENDIAVGQSATVSIPATMAQLDGVVHEVHKVQYVAPEGGMFFEVVIALDNPGALGKDMAATATLSAGGETIYPYEPGTLDYFRMTEVKAPLSGNLTSFVARSYLKVAAGESIAHIKADTENYEDTLKNYTDRVDDAKKSLQSAQEMLEKAQENLEKLHGVAPIDGTVLTIGVQAGEEAKSGTVAVSIADTTTMIVNTQIDEMNVSYAKAGMMVDINLWDNQMFGTIESVSLTATSENGVARFPMVISVDNSEGKLMSGAYVDYSFTASQSDDCLVVPIQCVKSAQDVNGESVKVLFVQSDAAPENLAELSMDLSEVPEGFWPVVVETGISDSYNVEILSGVDEGVFVFAGTVDNGGMGGIGLYF